MAEPPVVEVPAPDFDLDRCLPHRPPFRFVEAVLSRTAGGGVCAGQISEAAATAAGGCASSILGIELGAQAAALLAALDRVDAGAQPPERGYLVTIRRADFRRPVLPVGVALHVTVAMVGRAGPLSMVEIAVATGDDPALVIVEAVLGLFVEETVS